MREIDVIQINQVEERRVFFRFYTNIRLDRLVYLIGFPIGFLQQIFRRQAWNVIHRQSIVIESRIIILTAQLQDGLIKGMGIVDTTYVIIQFCLDLIFDLDIINITVC